MASIADSLKGFASPRYMILSVVGVALLLVFSFLSYRLSEPVMSTLYSNLNADDSAAVVTELGALGVKFEVKSGGGEILVQSPDVLKVRMQLAEKGLPGKANIVGYEIFDKENMLGTSNFVMNVNLVRALEGELSRTIASLSSIKSARVHLVIPRKDIYKHNSFEPSASVVLVLNNRLDVAKEEAQAVKHIISSSVPGLSPNRITIVDSNGKMLAKARNDEENGENQDSEEDSDLKFQMEERFKNQINNMISQVVGQGRVEATVTVDTNLERSTETSETYDPDGQVARSTQTTESLATSNGNSGGSVSVANELTGAAGAGGNSENNQKTDEVTNFEISKKVTNKVNGGGQVKKISVAVLVDGVYTKDASGKETYTPRTDEQIDQIKTLVKSAVGYDEARGDKVDVINMQFNQSNPDTLPVEGPLDWLKRDLDSIIKTVVLGIVAILTIMLVIRPLVNKAFNVSAADIEAQEIKMMANNEALTQATAGITSPESEGSQINLDVIQSKIDYSPTQKVNDLIDNNPEETLSIIRSWLAENKG